MRNRPTRRPSPRPTAGRPALFEGLESRRLMSAAMIASPLTDAAPAGSGVPLGSTAPVGYSPAQIRGAYGIGSISINGVAGDGAGQTVAVVVAYDNPNVAGDLTTFSNTYGLGAAPSFKKVNEFGGTSLPGIDSTGGWENESALDVEWVHAVAPKANILLVECNSASLDDLIAAGVNYARSAAGVSVVTMSFAATEAAGETGYDAYFSTPGGHPGVTFVAASGDGGSPGGYPAVSPDVVSVGATTLTVSGNGYAGETGRSKSGGGYSVYESRPSFQSAVNSTGKRASPDVAFDGDPNTGVSVYDSFNGTANTPWYKVGGTSFSAPAWAGLIAIADQGRANAGAAPYDGVNGTLPRLYALAAADFHDITSGNNGYAATAGYDLVTGRGTPVANALVPDLANVTRATASTGSVSGYVRNGSTNAAIGGATVYLDLNNDGRQDNGEYGTPTNGAGYYAFGNLPAFTYVIRETVPTGYTLSAPSAGYQSVKLAAGQNAANVNFADAATTSPAKGSISGYVRNATTNAAIAGATVYLDLNNDGKQDNGEYGTPTNGSGYYYFGNLPAFTYVIRETVPSGYKLSTPSAGYQSVTLATGQTAANVNFADAPTVSAATGSISGYVFNSATGTGFGGATVYLDLNNDGKQDNGEYGTAANQYGYFYFGNMPAGTYVLREVVPPGYTAVTYPAAGYWTVTLTAGQNATNISFGNKKA